MRVVEQCCGDAIEHRAVLADVGDDLLHLVGDRPSLVLSSPQVEWSTASLVEFDEFGVEFVDLALDVFANSFRIVGHLSRDPVQTGGHAHDGPAGGDAVLAPQPTHVCDHRARLGAQEAHVGRRRRCCVGDAVQPPLLGPRLDEIEAGGLVGGAECGDVAVEANR